MNQIVLHHSKAFQIIKRNKNVRNEKLKNIIDNTDTILIRFDKFYSYHLLSLKFSVFLLILFSAIVFIA